jgi:hypothetical protein
MFNPRTTQVIELIQAFLDACYCAYIATAILITMARIYLWARTGVRQRFHRRSFLGRWINRIWYWCKWPALAFLILDPFFYLILGQKMDWSFWLFEALGFYNWWVYKDAGDDDDEFKKQFKKASQKIIESGGKLIVVPESA